MNTNKTECPMKGRMSQCKEGECFHNKNREEENKKQRIFQRKQKEKTIIHYGGKCACCGETIIEFLKIEKIKKDDQEKIKLQIAIWLRKKGYPKGYRVLCHNCSIAIGLYGHCPHKTEKSKN